MVRKSLIMKLGCLTLFFTLVAGCSSQEPTINPNPTANRLPKVTSTPVIDEDEIPETGLLCKSSLAHVRLKQGSDLYLSALTRVSILEYPDWTAEASILRVFIEQGKLAILSQPLKNISYILETPSGIIARINSGFMIVEYVEYDEDKQELFAYCINGPCEIGLDLNFMNLIETGHSGVINHRGTFADLGEIPGDDLISGCEEDHLVLEVPTTPTPDLGATATAFCGEFEENNPGTPCP